MAEPDVLVTSSEEPSRRLARAEEEVRALREAARAQLRIIHDLGRAVSRARGAEEIYREALEALTPAAGCDRASVLLFDDHGVMRFVAWRGLSEPYRRAVEGHSPWAPDAPAPRSIVVPDVTADPGLDPLRPVFDAEGIRALVFVPLLQSRLLGKFMLYYDHPRDLTAEELALVEAIALHVGYAIERARAEERLLLYREIVDKGNDAIAIMDPSGRCLEQNQAHRALLGYPDAELIGRTPAVYLGQEAFARAAADLAREGTCRTEVRSTTRDRRHLDLDLSAFTLRDGAGRTLCHVGIQRDITERKDAERRMAEQARQLERSNAELERFAYVASHDLREPLRTVASYSELLRKRYAGTLDADAEEFLGFIVGGVRRMNALIDGLLEFSKVGSLREDHVPVAMAEVAREVLDGLRAAVEESGAVVTVGELPTVSGDPAQLRQLLQNLLSNALKFRGPQAPEVELSARPAAGGWEFAVRDNGIGIRPEHRDRIFLLFQRLHHEDQYPGTGLGLAICNRIVERHGGRIWVESEPGGPGSTFRFTLRAAPSRGPSRH